MQIEELKRKVQPLCERQKVRRLDLFGSRARADGSEASDFDFVAEFEAVDPEKLGRYYFNLLHELEDTLHKPVDLLTYDAVAKPRLRRNIEADRVNLYARTD
ncbi:MAG: nucleotidyltransferase domain-containing protein [Verrucomicrobiota bacterium JB022]|nr:nucleotidyltransferase domain-containing protein [Verrucomicrobiota bacterium JB022]